MSDLLNSLKDEVSFIKLTYFQMCVNLIFIFLTAAMKHSEEEIDMIQKLQKIADPTSNGIRDECNADFDKNKEYILWILFIVHFIQLLMAYQPLKYETYRFKKYFGTLAVVFIIVDIIVAALILPTVWDQLNCNSLIRLQAVVEVILMIIKIPNSFFERWLFNKKTIQIAEWVIKVLHDHQVEHKHKEEEDEKESTA